MLRFCLDTDGPGVVVERLNRNRFFTRLVHPGVEALVHDLPLLLAQVKGRRCDGRIRRLASCGKEALDTADVPPVKIEEKADHRIPVNARESLVAGTGPTGMPSRSQGLTEV
jgi:hypothetical protein